MRSKKPEYLHGADVRTLSLLGLSLLPTLLFANDHEKPSEFVNNAPSTATPAASDVNHLTVN